MTDFWETKAELRKAIQAIEPRDRLYKDDSINCRLKDMDELKNSESVFAFMPFRSEPNILPFIEEIHKNGKEVALPRCLDASRMIFLRYSGRDFLKGGLFGIFSPEGEEALEPKKDVILVPMLAFDRNKCRLGRGKGYYDRYLEKYPMAIKIGVCYSDFEVTSVFAEAHDLPLDMILTDEEIIR